ncbi:very low-density lipoprotein receptor-like isoform X8 [Eriocheir sinensis]|uniref:very low-density lipoprotein receptor-like isoform X8 n=1 Tax=Eriocheir sinensis TaxID=95602 RepID=UPI0021C89AC4|nr:very low-density lipoprotein receptor-like isoform X8 [Eriocheir sinensis]
MPPLHSLVVVLLLAASLAHSLPQDGPSRNSDFTFADKTMVLASRVSGRDLTRPRRQSSSSRLVDYQGGSGKLEYKDERDMDEPGTDSVRLTLKNREVGCPWDDYHVCLSGLVICHVDVCDGQADCPDGDDEQDCDTHTHTHTECSNDEFLCDNTKCIPKDWLCDGDDDCEDKTDEQDCGGLAFQRSEMCFSAGNAYKCKSGDKICGVKVCDGREDCPDGDDEQDCDTHTHTHTECSNDKFLCDNTKCIPKVWLCDGEEDCEDKTDEQDCSERCRHWEFRCRDGSCINQRLRCNGRRDCRDGSDEWQCRRH